MSLIAAFKENPKVNIFELIEDAPHVLDAKFKPLSVNSVPYQEGFFIIKAFHVLGQNQNEHCFMDLTMNERINDYAYFIENGKVVQKEPSQCPGEIIPAVGIETYGNYELFYSKKDPQLSISTLEKSLKISKNNPDIAADLGYICRDEALTEKAIKAFEIAVKNGDEGGFLFLELAQLYGAMGNDNLRDKYKQLAKKNLGDQYPS